MSTGQRILVVSWPCLLVISSLQSFLHMKAVIESLTPHLQRRNRLNERAVTLLGVKLKQKNGINFETRSEPKTVRFWENRSFECSTAHSSSSFNTRGRSPRQTMFTTWGLYCTYKYSGMHSVLADRNIRQRMKIALLRESRGGIANENFFSESSARRARPFPPLDCTQYPQRHAAVARLSLLLEDLWYKMVGSVA